MIYVLMSLQFYGNIYITVRGSDHLHKAFKLTAVKQGRSMGAVTIELIERYVKRASGLL